MASPDKTAPIDKTIIGKGGATQADLKKYGRSAAKAMAQKRATKIKGG